MREIITRFRNQQDLDNFSKKINIKLEQNMATVNMSTNEITYSKPVRKRGMRKTDWKKEWINMYEWNLDFADEVFL